MKKLVFAILLASMAVFAGEFKEVEWSDAVALSKKGAVFLDVRNPDETAQGIVTGAILIPLPEIQKRFAELPKDKQILVYCRSGRRSAAAAGFLVDQGYNVVNVKGGFLAVPPKSVLPHN